MPSPSVVVSQVYGGAGCTTAGCSIYKNDYVELFNRGASPVSLGGWSVQYAPASGTAWSVTPLTNVTLQPGQYYLLQEGTTSANGVSALPTPDATGGISMSATAGKVALVNSTAALTGACPARTSFLDLVGYGSTASCSETAPAPAPSTTTADVRKGGGCTETDNNSADFSATTPMPHNTASPANPCASASFIPTAELPHRAPEAQTFFAPLLAVRLFLLTRNDWRFAVESCPTAFLVNLAARNSSAKVPP
jgi:predicted extracellular nuclease